MRKEINISGYDLIISDDGRVWSPERDVVLNTGRVCHYKEKELTTFIHPSGYRVLSVSRNGILKMFQLHRLVAEAFLINYNNLPQVNHIDGNKLNNNVSNLEWCSCRDNIIHSHVTGLNKGPTKKVICVETMEVFDSQKEAAEAYHTTQSSISNVCTGRQSHIHGYHFKFFK